MWRARADARDGEDEALKSLEGEVEEAEQDPEAASAAKDDTPRRATAEEDPEAELAKIFAQQERSRKKK